MGAGVKERECEKVGSGVWGVQTDRERRVMGRERVGTKKKKAEGKRARWVRGVGLHKQQEVSQGCHSG